MPFIFSDSVALTGVKCKKYSKNQSVACLLQAAAQDTMDPRVFPLAHWSRRHSVGLRNTGLDESKHTPGPPPPVLWCLGEVDELKHQTIRLPTEHERRTRALCVVCLAPKHARLQEEKAKTSHLSVLMDNNPFKAKQNF